MKNTNRKITGKLAAFLAAVMAVTAAASICASAETQIADSGAYTVTAVDGNIDWSSIPELTLDNILWRPDCGVRASGQFCYDDDALYVHLRAVEQDIRAEYTEPMSPVYQDSCLEFFFMPEGGDRYFNFEINLNGALYTGIGSSIYDHTPIYIDDVKTYFDIRSDRTSDGWEVFYTIPKEFIAEYYEGFEFSGGLRANIYKCGDKTAQAHYLTWQPIDTKSPAFHKPEFFGKMMFENR